MVEVEEQLSLFDLGTGSLKTCRDCTTVVKEETSRQSLRSLSGSRSRNLPMFLCLKTESGPKQDACMGWEQTGFLSASHGSAMTLNGGEFHSGEDGFVYWETSTDLLPGTFYLTLNCGEKPRVQNPTKLSEILEEDPDSRYDLSEKACQGILNRAKKRGKELPEELRMALEQQAGYA